MDYSFTTASAVHISCSRLRFRWDDGPAAWQSLVGEAEKSIRKVGEYAAGPDRAVP